MKAINYFIILIIIIYGCSTEVDNKKISEKDVDSINLISNPSKDSIKKQANTQVITNRFLGLVRFIDSCGYLQDTLRIKKTYSKLDISNKISISGYYFYKFKVENTIPFIEFDILSTNIGYDYVKNHDTTGLYEMEKTKGEWMIDFELLKKVKNIYAYHFVTKKASDWNSQKVYIDGIIEEWEFTNSNVARRVGEELGNKESFVYFNRGAYVCYINNHVYVFHSRSAGFYTPLMEFFNYFVKNYNVIKANNGKLRQNF